jgi:putative tributyrin esterase
MALVSFKFSSHFLHGNHEISIILPDRPQRQLPKDFYGNGQKYKVLWLLHGAFGDHTDWIRKSKIELYARERDLCVVMPSAFNSNYTNWDQFALGFAFWDYLTEELMPMIYNWFPVSDQRADNFVAGLSMGGRGALKLAVNHPAKFAAAAILSASPINFCAIDPEDGTSHWQRLIDNAGSLDNLLHSADNVWDKLAALAGQDILPKLYFTMGTDDDAWYPQYLAFKQYALSLPLAATFDESPGGHDWRFWDNAIEKALRFFDSCQ